jgi:hypothetical protein
VSKSGDDMIGPLEMGGNKITELYNEYPPTNMNGDEAITWDQMGLKLINYVIKQGGMMTGPLGVGRGIIINTDA